MRMKTLTSSMNNAVFRLCGMAPAFVSRDVGRAIRQKIIEFEKEADIDAVIVIDFDGVDVLTPSFVDECLGRLVASIGLEHFRERFKIHADRSDWKALINSVVRNRLQLDYGKS